VPTLRLNPIVVFEGGRVGGGREKGEAPAQLIALSSPFFLLHQVPIKGKKGGKEGKGENAMHGQSP